MTTNHLKARGWRLLATLFILGPLTLYGQQRAITLDEAIRTTLHQNPGLKAAASETRAARYQKRTSVDIPKTQLMWMSGQYNSINKDNNLTLTQSLPFPTVFTSQSKLGEIRIESGQFREVAARNELVYQLHLVHQTLQYLYARQQLLLRQDTLFTELVRTTSLQLSAGEGTLLQKTSAETRLNEVKNQLRQNAADQLTYNAQLRVLLNTADEVTLIPVPFVPLSTPLFNDSTQVSNNPQLVYQRSLQSVASQEKRVEANRALPDLTLGYFNQSLIGVQTQLDGTDRYYSSSDRFSGFMLGVSVPIWFVPASARVKAAGARSDAARYNTEQLERQLHGEWNKAIQQFEKYRNTLAYYSSSALPNAELLLKQSVVSFRAGEISQADYRLNVQQALGIQESYIQTVLSYNQSIHTLEFLTGVYSKN